MIYVTVGTMFLDFQRLIAKMDAIAAASGERVLIQTGMSTTLPAHAEHFAFKPHDELAAVQREARLIVSHAGIGCVRDALRADRSLVVVPRLKRFREHINDHQLDLARAVERRGWGRMVLDVDELDALCAAPPPAPEGYRPSSEPLVAAVRAAVERAAGERAAGKRSAGKRSAGKRSAGKRSAGKRSAGKRSAEERATKQ